MKDNRCSRRTRILRAIEHARRKRLTKGEKKRGRKSVIKGAIADVASAPPEVFMRKADYDAAKKAPKLSIREMADKLYKEQYGSG